MFDSIPVKVQCLCSIVWRSLCRSIGCYATLAAHRLAVNTVEDLVFETDDKLTEL